MSRYQEVSTLKYYYVTLSSEKSSNAINSTLEYYVRQALRYKYCFFVLSIIMLVLNSLIPILNQVDNSSKLIITVMSSINLVLTGVSALLSAKDNWSRYREAAEKLKVQCNMYNAKACPYSNQNPRINEILLIYHFQDITASVRKQWSGNSSGDKMEKQKDVNIETDLKRTLELINMVKQHNTVENGENSSIEEAKKNSSDSTCPYQ